MFNFNNNEEVARLVERIEALEKRVAELEARLSQQDVKEERGESREERKPTATEPAFIAELSSIIPNVSAERETTSRRTYYLTAPNANGVFAQVSPREQIGKSIYQLTTEDGVNGQFVMLDTPDAIATAMISTSQFIKPACKVVGESARYPRRIVTEEEGTATFQAGEWRVSRKAVVRFE